MKLVEVQWPHKLLIDLHQFYLPTFRQNPSASFRNMEESTETRTSLAILVMLSDECREEMQAEVPPYILQLDLASPMEITKDNDLIIESGEIKYTANGKKSAKNALFIARKH